MSVANRLDQAVNEVLELHRNGTVWASDVDQIVTATGVEYDQLDRELRALGVEVRDEADAAENPRWVGGFVGNH